MRILLSIKPEYVSKIISGEKTYEFRKRLPKLPVEAIVIYSTAPYCKIIGEVQVKGTITDTVSKIWNDTKGNAGISYKKYLQYFKNKKTANAFVLGKVKVYDEKKELSEFGIKHAPQSFIYLK